VRQCGVDYVRHVVGVGELTAAYVRTDTRISVEQYLQASRPPADQFPRRMVFLEATPNTDPAPHGHHHQTVSRWAFGHPHKSLSLSYKRHQPESPSSPSGIAPPPVAVCTHDDVSQHMPSHAQHAGGGASPRRTVYTVGRNGLIAAWAVGACNSTHRTVHSVNIVGRGLSAAPTRRRRPAELKLHSE
jgi:hypothetical protein